MGIVELKYSACLLHGLAYTFQKLRTCCSNVLNCISFPYNGIRALNGFNTTQLQAALST
jgi:hypothetical protein